jgi:manganese/zinc/iron transport system permease protein
MSLPDLLHGLLFDFTLRTVALGAAVLGALAGALGCFAVLRQQSLLGDAISHAALPGIVLAFVLTGSRATPVLVLGAGIAGWLGTLAVMAIVRGGRLPEDTALGIVLSVFFGFGMVLLTWVQGRPDARQAGLDTFLFGQAATVLPGDVALVAGVGSVAGLLTILFWKEFKLLTFDPDYATALGLPLRRVDFLLTGLLVVAIVLGLQMVGVVLMSALVVAPAAAARQWTESLRTMVLLAAMIGAGAGVTGAAISATARGVPTGPTIVLVASAVVAFSLLAAPRRGLVAEMVRSARVRRRIRADAMLMDLYALSRQHAEPGHPHPVATLRAMSGRERGVSASLRTLEARGWAVHSEEDDRDPRVRRLSGRSEARQWAITEAGRIRARQLLDTGFVSPPEERPGPGTPEVPA